MGLTGLTTLAINRIEQQRQATEHQRQVTTITANLQAVINQKIAQPTLLATLIESSATFAPQQFTDLSQGMLKGDRAITALGWVESVPQAQRPAYEARYGPIVDQTPNGKWQPATDRSEYFPITQNITVGQDDRLGWDVAQDPIQLKGLATAHGSGLIAMTDLVPQPDRRHTFFAFVPVFQNRGQPDPAIRGFVQAGFQLQLLLESALAQIDAQGKDLYIANGDHSPAQAFRLRFNDQNQAVTWLPSPLDWRDVCPQIQRCESQITIGQYRWRVLIPPHASPQLSRNFQRQLWLIWLLGGGSTIALTAYTAIGIRQTRRIRQLVADQTRQTQTLTQTLSELQATQTQLVQSAKMSSLGQLVAGIAHEVNNPVNFIHGNLRYVERYSQDLLAIVDTCQASSTQPQMFEAFEAEYELDFLRADLPKLLVSMQGGTQRIREIVLNLRNFSRLDEAELKVVNLHEGIESTLMILQHRLGKTELVKQYGDLPLIRCYPGLLNQVLMNLLANAIDAVATNPPDRPAQITIQTRLVGDLVQIGIGDNGSGISEAHQASLFNPFFTTKPVGEGTGLGLSISYKIITEQHKGRIWAESIIDQGTTFWIELLPLPAAKAVAA
jgi:two-component system, NtrC family, sensor kinase